HSINIHFGGTTTGSHARKKLVRAIGSPHLVSINPLERYLAMILGKGPAWHPIGEKRKQVSAHPAWRCSGRRTQFSAQPRNERHTDPFVYRNRDSSDEPRTCVDGSDFLNWPEAQCEASMAPAFQIVRPALEGLWRFSLT